MITIGKINKLRVSKSSDAGYFFADDTGNEVLLPASHAPEQLKTGDSRDVFIYTDAEGKILGSLKKPVVQVGGFALLRVSDVTPHGAFMKWGLEKDLFIPFSEQKVPMEREQYYVIHVYIDEISKRIAGSSRIDKFLSNEEHTLEKGQEVDILVFEESPLGFSCIINDKHRGLLYHNEIFQDVFIGEEMTAYVKTVREDKLIDLSLQKSGFSNVLSATEIVLEYLKNHDGFISLHDKSSPDEIASELNMSKATYKKAIGILYRQRQVLIKPDGVYLVKTEDQDEKPE